MRKLGSAAVALVLLAIVLATATPASAGPRVCFGQGSVTLSGFSNGTGLWAPPGPPTNVSSVSGSIACLAGVTVPYVRVSGGLLSATCSRASGNPLNPISLTSGTHTHSHEIFEWMGSMWLGVDTDGAGVFVAHAFPDPLHPHSNNCLNGTAHEFIVTGGEAPVF